MKPRRRQRFVPAYKARRRARERSAFMADITQARLESIVQWLEQRNAFGALSVHFKTH